MIRSRIAPTPSGYLHIGNAFNFIMTWLWVRKEGGKLRLRIDDIDAPRARTEYINDIFTSLDWLGIDWDEGPKSTDEHLRQYTQSLRGDRYDQCIAHLIRSGQVYACTCSRIEIRDGSCTCRNKHLPFDQPDTTLRIIVPDLPIMVKDAKARRISVDLKREMGDFAIRRRDGIAAYQVASLCDDMDHQTNLIIRGADLLSSTAAQLYLASLIDPNDFDQTTFYHHPLIIEDGHKLSKSAGSYALRSMREAGITKGEICRRISKMLKLPGSYTSLQEMLDHVKAYSLPLS